MKFLRKILAGIAVLLALICVLIGVSSMNPALSTFLSQYSEIAGSKIEEIRAANASSEEEAVASSSVESSEDTAVSDSSTEASSEEVTYTLVITEDGQYTVVPSNATESITGDSEVTENAASGAATDAEEVQVVKKSYNEYNSRENWNEAGIAEDTSSNYKGSTNANDDSVLSPEKNDYVPTEIVTTEITEENEDLLEEYTEGDLGSGLEFDELYYPYYNMLDEKCQAIYRQLYANTLDQNQKIKLSEEEASSMEVQNAFLSMVYDHPELFWVDTQYYTQLTSSGTVAAVDVVYYEFPTDIETASTNFETAANNILSGVDELATEYEKELYIHNALADKITYDLDADYNQSAYSAIVNSNTVCAGYSRAFQYLMQQLEIPTYTCIGWGGGSSGGMHGWNIIGLDDGYYNVDVTWDDSDPTIYDYFNKSDSDFNDLHSRMWLSVYLPACNGTTYSGLEKNSLSDFGLSASDVIYSMDDYYSICSQKVSEAIAEKPGEEFEFQVVISEDIYSEWKSSYNSGEYYSGFLTDIAMSSDSILAVIYCEDAQLSEGCYLINVTGIVK